MQGALDELRWFVNDLKKMELFKLSETVPAPALRTKQSVIPANMRHKIKVRDRKVRGNSKHRETLEDSD